MCRQRPATAGAQADGTDPTPLSAVFGAPIALGTTQVVLKAMASHPDLTDSDVVVSLPFTIRATPPEFTPDGGTFVGEADIHISSATPGAAIHCTTDGSPPSAVSPVCSNPVRVTTSGTVIRAVAAKNGLSDSVVAQVQRVGKAGGWEAGRQGNRQGGSVHALAEDRSRERAGGREGGEDSRNDWREGGRVEPPHAKPEPRLRAPRPSALDRNLMPQIRNPKPETLNPKPYTQNPKPRGVVANHHQT